jgi:hypothetical protein
VHGGGYSTRIRCLFLAVAFARLRFALRSLLALACVYLLRTAFVLTVRGRLVCGSWSCVCTMALALAGNSSALSEPLMKLHVAQHGTLFLRL